MNLQSTPDLSLVVVSETYLVITACIELEYAADNQGDNSETTEPPCGGDACCEAGYNQKDRPDDVENYGKGFHKAKNINSFDFVIK